MLALNELPIFKYVFIFISTFAACARTVEIFSYTTALEEGQTSSARQGIFVKEQMDAADVGASLAGSDIEIYDVTSVSSCVTCSALCMSIHCVYYTCSQGICTPVRLVISHFCLQHCVQYVSSHTRTVVLTTCKVLLLKTVFVYVIIVPQQYVMTWTPLLRSTRGTGQPVYDIWMDDDAGGDDMLLRQVFDSSIPGVFKTAAVELYWQDVIEVSNVF